MNSNLDAVAKSTPFIFRRIEIRITLNVPCPLPRPRDACQSIRNWKVSDQCVTAAVCFIEIFQSETLVFDSFSCGLFKRLEVFPFRTIPFFNFKHLFGWKTLVTWKCKSKMKDDAQLSQMQAKTCRFDTNITCRVFFFVCVFVKKNKRKINCILLKLRPNWMVHSFCACYTNMILH